MAILTAPSASIRSYSLDVNSHQHGYHQLVMPLQGVISIQVGTFTGQVGPGDCVIIAAGCEHAFSALEQAKFLVVDSPKMPEKILKSGLEVVSLSLPTQAYVQFIEQQLLYLTSEDIDPKVLELLLSLLSQQSYTYNKDKRIEKTIRYIDAHLSCKLSLEQLSKLACLSETQFKLRFKQATGCSSQAYITQKRMDRAKALLLNSDTPISIVAEMVGYQNQSAFTRRFKQTFGLTPKQWGNE